jgi:hypothetical protein
MAKKPGSGNSDVKPKRPFTVPSNSIEIRGEKVTSPEGISPKTPKETRD